MKEESQTVNYEAEVQLNQTELVPQENLQSPQVKFTFGDEIKEIVNDDITNNLIQNDIIINLEENKQVQKVEELKINPNVQNKPRPPNKFKNLINYFEKQTSKTKIDVKKRRSSKFLNKLNLAKINNQTQEESQKIEIEIKIEVPKIIINNEEMIVTRKSFESNLAEIQSEFARKMSKDTVVKPSSQTLSNASFPLKMDFNINTEINIKNNTISKPNESNKPLITEEDLKYNSYTVLDYQEEKFIEEEYPADSFCEAFFGVSLPNTNPKVINESENFFPPCKHENCGMFPAYKPEIIFRVPFNDNKKFDLNSIVKIINCR
jgi:hypothetical protein